VHVQVSELNCVASARVEAAVKLLLRHGCERVVLAVRATGAVPGGRARGGGGGASFPRAAKMCLHRTPLLAGDGARLLAASHD
jgi:hypothetical protein